MLITITSRLKHHISLYLSQYTVLEEEFYVHKQMTNDMFKTIFSLFLFHIYRFLFILFTFPAINTNRNNYDQLI